MLALKRELLPLLLLLPWCEGVAFPGPAPTTPPSHEKLNRYYKGEKLEPTVTGAPDYQYLMRRQASSISISFGATLGFGAPNEEATCGYVEGRFGKDLKIIFEINGNNRPFRFPDEKTI